MVRGFNLKNRFWYHWADLGCHCDVGATADTFGRWQWEGNTLKNGTGLIWLGRLMADAG